MKPLIMYINDLQLTSFNRLGLDIHGTKMNRLPDRKIMRDIRIAKKENKELDRYIDSYVKDAKKIHTSFFEEYIAF